MNRVNEFLDFKIISFKDYSLTFLEIGLVILILIVTKLILWFISKAIFKKTIINHLDNGSRFALFQLIKYLIWIISIVSILEVIGVKASLLLASSAALLVGVGLGLQQTFNDILSGIILLYEKSVKVGDILNVDGEVVKIQEIGLRTSICISTTNISIILPNSLITTSKVINWSNQSKQIFFSVDVGVAYGSNVDLVISILEESAREHTDVLKDEIIQGRLLNFGNSSLDFRVLFCSENGFAIEKIKSDIRRTISRKLDENGLTIPFPQMDLYIKSNEKK